MATGHWKGNVRLSEQILVIKLNLINSILFLKPHLNHPVQRWVTQASILYFSVLYFLIVCLF